TSVKSSEFAARMRVFAFGNTESQKRKAELMKTASALLQPFDDRGIAEPLRLHLKVFGFAERAICFSHRVGAKMIAGVVNQQRGLRRDGHGSGEIARATDARDGQSLQQSFVAGVISLRGVNDHSIYLWSEARASNAHN